MGQTTSPTQSLRAAYESVRKSFDPVKGGFSTAPKFPRPVLIQFLFYYSLVKPDSEGKHALEMALFTLVPSAEHCGGGGGL